MFHWQLSFFKVSTRFILFATANINKKEETTYKRPMILRIFVDMKAYIYRLFAIWVLTTISSNAIAQKIDSPLKSEGIDAFLRRHGRTAPEAKTLFIELNKGRFNKDGGLRMDQTYILPDSTVSTTTQNTTTQDSATIAITTQDSTAVVSSSNDTVAKSAQTATKPTQVATAKQPTQPQTTNTSTSKSSQRTITEPLFGKSLKSVTIKSQELAGACFYLVSGHGGPDPGAVSKVGGVTLHEDEYAYDITLRLARNLMERGAKVHIIIQDSKDGIRDDKHLSNSKRETCLGKAIPLNHTRRLKQRCDAINRLARKDKERYKRAIFIHVDSRRVKEQIDVFLYHAPNSTLGRRLANNIRNTIEDKYGQHQPGRGFKGTVSDRRLYVLRETTPVAAFLELGNIQNEKDRKRLVIPNNRQALANWICQGIIKDYKK